MKRLNIDVDGDGDSDLADLKALTPKHARLVYETLYWDTVRADQLPPGVNYTVADFSVNSGPGRAARYLQKVVGVKQDGAIGPKTLDAVAVMPATEIVNRVNDERLAFMKRIKNKRTVKWLWLTFGDGWENRVDDVRALSLEWATHRPQPISPVLEQPARDDIPEAFAALAAQIQALPKEAERKEALARLAEASWWAGDAA